MDNRLQLNRQNELHISSLELHQKTNVIIFPDGGRWYQCTIQTDFSSYLLGLFKKEKCSVGLRWAQGDDGWMNFVFSSILLHALLCVYFRGMWGCDHRSNGCVLPVLSCDNSTVEQDFMGSWGCSSTVAFHHHNANGEARFFMSRPTAKIYSLNIPRNRFILHF